MNMPRECLPRFLAIAKVNTMINRETCGLLLGKDKGHKFVVTTMLIPKQHSTSDTCAMDGEELVLRFTEERNLITLGWVSVVAVYVFLKASTDKIRLIDSHTPHTNLYVFSCLNRALSLISVPILNRLYVFCRLAYPLRISTYAS